MNRRKRIALGSIVMIVAVLAGGVVASAAGAWFLPTYSGAFCGDYPDDPRCQTLGQAVFEPNLFAGAATTIAILLVAALLIGVWYSATRR